MEGDGFYDWWGCERKHRYPSHEAARKAKKRRSASAAKKRRKPPVRTYHCDLCDGYHLTSKPLDTRPQSVLGS